MASAIDVLDPPVICSLTDIGFLVRKIAASPANREDLDTYQVPFFAAIVIISTFFCSQNTHFLVLRNNNGGNSNERPMNTQCCDLIRTIAYVNHNRQFVLNASIYKRAIINSKIVPFIDCLNFYLSTIGNHMRTPCPSRAQKNMYLQDLAFELMICPSNRDALRQLGFCFTAPSKQSIP